MDFQPKHEFSDFHINDLMAILREGKENATNRKMLAQKLDMSDRRARKLVEQARLEGCMIINTQDGNGYYLPKDISDILTQYRQDTNRAMAILVRRKHMRKLLKEAGIET